MTPVVNDKILVGTMNAQDERIARIEVIIRVHKKYIQCAYGTDLCTIPIKDIQYNANSGMFKAYC